MALEEERESHDLQRRGGGEGGGREGKGKRVKEKGKVGTLLSSRVLKQKPTACGGCGCGTLSSSYNVFPPTRKEKRKKKKKHSLLMLFPSLSSKTVRNPLAFAFTRTDK